MFRSLLSKDDKIEIIKDIKKKDNVIKNIYVEDIFIIISTFLQPNQIQNLLLSNKVIYKIMSSNVIWENYLSMYLFSKYKFNLEEIQENFYKNFFYKQRHPFTMNKKISNKRLKITNLTAENQYITKSRNDFDADEYSFSNNIPSNCTEAFINVKYHTSIRGCSLGFISETDLNRINDKQDTKVVLSTRYFRDGTIMLRKGEKILNRIQPRQNGDGLIKVFYSIEAGDVVGIKINFEKKKVVYYVNGLETNQVDVLIDVGEKYYFSFSCPYTMKFEILSNFKFDFDFSYQKLKFYYTT
jgi:hypothetical protein